MDSNSTGTGATAMQKLKLIIILMQNIMRKYKIIYLCLPVVATAAATQVGGHNFKWAEPAAAAAATAATAATALATATPKSISISSRKESTVIMTVLCLRHRRSHGIATLDLDLLLATRNSRLVAF